MIKLKLEFEMTEEDLRETFESYDLKFTKKKMAELKRALKEEDTLIRDDMEEDFKIAIGNFLSEMFTE